MSPTIFISHRSIDRGIADMLIDFLVLTGIPADAIFCSSRPGNDVQIKIGAEVKEKLENSVVNIMLLSEEYLKSAYCLNEAGIIWYRDDVTCIPIALPGIDDSKMRGFFSYDNKFRRLDSATDIADIYDIIRTKLDVPAAKSAVIMNGIERLRTCYQEYIQEGSRTEQDTDAGILIEDGSIDYQASILLLCAIDNRGEIQVTKSLSGIYYSSGRFTYNHSQEARELAAWDGAVDALLQSGYIKMIESSPALYKVTRTGYAFGDRFKKRLGIDTSRSPQQVLDALEEIQKRMKGK